MQKKNNILFIIVIMSLALPALVAMQWYWINESYKLKSQLFDENVNRALNEVVKKLEKTEAVNFIRQHGAIFPPHSMSKNIPSLPKKPNAPKLILKGKLEIPTHEKLKVIVHGDELMSDSTSMISGKIIDSSRVIVYNSETNHGSTGKVTIRASGKRNDIHIQEFFDKVNKSNKKIEVFEGLANEFERIKMPLRKRVDSTLIDSLIRTELVNMGIELPYQYIISGEENDTLILYTPFSVSTSTKEVEYETALYPGDILGAMGTISISFRDKNHYLLRNMTVLMASSAGLLFLVIVAFAYTILSLLKQKKLSEMKTDFINNMTHEFKTPVSTIMIASEALKDPDISKDSKRLLQLANVIYDENLRMNAHVERVLNMASMEKEKFSLSSEEINIHTLINKAIENLTLLLEKKSATIVLELNATQKNVIGDELHLSNVLLNLIDNACKYGGENPQISIRTENQNNGISISIEDKGIGMKKEQLKRIFDAFYRVPTGNLHDVKGFGLGLHYVHMIINRSGGKISVKSEENMGSTFELFLPFH